MYPADKFVEDFVGSDRALKRLALQRVRDIDLWKAGTVRVGEDARQARAKLQDADLPYLLLVDDRGRPKGWLSERALAGERVLDDLRSSADPIVELDDILRDALSDLLAADTRYGPVVDESGAVRGILSIEAVGHALAATGSHVPTATELARDSAAEDGRAARDGLDTAPGSEAARS
jgi:osmoprotectant transport system ATP-binding protein